MKCRRAKTLIFDFIDGVIDDRNRLALEQHLGECKSCETMASGLSRSLAILHRLPPEEPEENFTWKVRLRLARERNAITDTAAVERSWLRNWNRRFALSALSACAVVIVAAYMVTRSDVVPDARLSLQAVPEVPPPTAVEKSDRAPGSTSWTPDRTLQTPVSTGDRPAQRGGGIPGALEEDLTTPVLNTDSLIARYLVSKAAREKVRILEQQIEALQGRIQECEQKK